MAPLKFRVFASLRLCVRPPSVKLCMPRQIFPYSSSVCFPEENAVFERQDRLRGQTGQTKIESGTTQTRVRSHPGAIQDRFRPRWQGGTAKLAKCTKTIGKENAGKEYMQAACPSSFPHAPFLLRNLMFTSDIMRTQSSYNTICWKGPRCHRELWKSRPKPVRRKQLRKRGDGRRNRGSSGG